MARKKILLFLVIVFCFAIRSAFSCGYQSCSPQSSYDKNKIYFHIVSHSHDDVGWLKSADNYYDEDVQVLLTNVMQSLQKSTNRKFVQVETYYFSRWWQRQNETVQAAVRQLVKNGQLTFANGGWSVNDEAATLYSNIIDQMTLGIHFIRETFGDCSKPKVSWQVDPFGASQEMANLYSLMGFDGHIVNRGHNLHGEFLWKASANNTIFTSVLHQHYSAPPGLNFEDADQITDQNKAEKAKSLVELGKRWNHDYSSKGHVLIPFGDDFRYKNAERWYTNLDKLIEVVNKNHQEVNLFYSSPQCYIKAIRDLKPKLEVRSHDYFPLWTGYYSSRPEVKYLDRYANNLLQAAKQLEVIANLSNTQSLIFESSNELGVLQHHDAITGTSKDPVMLDYKERLNNAILAASSVISRALGKLTSKGATVSNGLPIVYHTANISEVDMSFNTLASIIYNPLAHEQSTWLRIPVSENSSYLVYDFNGKEVPKVNHVPINSKVKSMVGHHRNISQELVFNAKLPALGYTSFFVVKGTDSEHLQNKQNISVNTQQELVLKGKNFELLVDSSTGKVKHIVKAGRPFRLTQSYHYYPSQSTSSSYEFCPSGGSVDISDYSSIIVSAVQYDGFAEVTQKINDWLWQTIRVYEDKEFAEFDWVIGPVAEKPVVGKDVITRFDTDLDTKGTFYTDANGRQDMKRKRDEVPRECHGTRNAISYNYYPITSRAILKDAQSGLEFSLLTDRSVGASSQEDGQLELMLHRRLFDRKTTDIPVDDRDLDGKGVVARGKVFMFLSEKSSAAADNYRPLSQFLFMQPIIAFSAIDNFTQYRNDHQVHFSALKTPLPENVHLLTLENWGNVSNNEVLVRFENFYQPDDASKLSAPASFNVANVFASLKPVDSLLTQTNLVADSRHNVTSTQLSISPSQIETFLLKVNRTLSNNSCRIKWQKRVSGGKLPPNAIKAGHEADGQPLYICRHASGDLMPGKYSDSIKCHVSFDGKEIAFNDDGVEILTGSEEEYLWSPRHGGDIIPANAFVAGHNAHGRPIYSGRCEKAERGQVLGKIDPSGGAAYFYYPFGGVEYGDCSNHEILVC